MMDGWTVSQRPGAVLCALSDGIGGADAAALTISMIRAAFDSGASPELVFSAISEANRSIFARSDAVRRREPGSDTRCCGKGCTAEVAIFVRGCAHLAHVGDGSVYGLRAGNLEALTGPHSLVNELRRKRPSLTDAELAVVPKNVIVRALGMGSEVEIDRKDTDALPGDVWLLCSDGLTSVLSDEAIRTVLRRNGSPTEIKDALMEAARATTDPELADDISVIVVIIGGSDPEGTAAR